MRKNQGPVQRGVAKHPWFQAKKWFTGDGFPRDGGLRPMKSVQGRRTFLNPEVQTFGGNERKAGSSRVRGEASAAAPEGSSFDYGDVGNAYPLRVRQCTPYGFWQR